ncbi:hypothetical protein AKJ09_07623 [Labilithrix luteola]|uniref:Uncharacterized protein n=1 Tax=Labilithrix luteola TaxID=1391654 RepID=A0A0K1Q6C1_9BACT|nr:hypothetical protein AKJ09_07623 [Labilithrix luteola]
MTGSVERGFVPAYHPPAPTLGEGMMKAAMNGLGQGSPS